MRARAARWCALALALGACGDGTLGGSPGDVTVSVWGEAFATEGIPPAAGEEPGFEDGWRVTFSKFLVNLGAVQLGAVDGQRGGSLPNDRVWDLTTMRGPAAVGTLPDVPSRRYDDVSFRIAPATRASTAGNAAADDVAAMQSRGYAVYAEGEATRAGALPVRFRWGFSGTTTYSRCESEGMAGVVVPSGGTASVHVTLHVDHLFYDDLQSPDAAIRFDAIAAADADMDREVTLDELARVPLASLPRDRYGTGSVPGVTDLRQFVTFLTATLGHYNGEGECRVTRSGRSGP